MWISPASILKIEVPRGLVPACTSDPAMQSVHAVPLSCFMSFIILLWSVFAHAHKIHHESIMNRSQSNQQRVYFMKPKTLASSILSACSTSLKEALLCASTEEKAQHRSELAQKCCSKGRGMKTDRCKSPVCRFNMCIHEFAKAKTHASLTLW